MDIESILGSDGPSPRVAYIDPTTGAEFRRYFDIVGRDMQIIKSGGTGTVKLSKYFDSPRLVSGDIEGSKEYIYTPFTGIMLCFFEALPCRRLDVSAAIVPAIDISFAAVHKITYYIDDRALPISDKDTNSSTVLVDSNIFTSVYNRPAGNDEDIKPTPYPLGPAIDDDIVVM